LATTPDKTDYRLSNPMIVQYTAAPDPIKGGDDFSINNKRQADFVLSRPTYRS